MLSACAGASWQQRPLLVALLLLAACVGQLCAVRAPLIDIGDAEKGMPKTVHIATSACMGSRGDQIAQELVAMANSVAAAASPERDYHIYAFANEEMKEKLTPWLTNGGGQALASKKVHLHIKHADMTSPYINAFRTCATERARLPKSLAQLDAVIYADVDTLWQVDPAEVWASFSHFSSSQSMGMSVETEAKQGAPMTDQPWVVEAYQRGLPWGQNGFNSGILLWNLTRARQLDDMGRILSTLKLLSSNYTKFFRYGDQDALNYMANEEPRNFYVLPCKHNLHVNSQCISQPDSPQAAVLHGNCGLFHQGRLVLDGHDYRSMFESFYRMNVSQRGTLSECCGPLRGIAWPPEAAQPSVAQVNNEECKPEGKAACLREAEKKGKSV